MEATDKLLRQQDFSRKKNDRHEELLRKEAKIKEYQAGHLLISEKSEILGVGGPRLLLKLALNTGLVVFHS